MTVNRSMLRYWLAGMLAIPLILLAVELSMAHVFFGEPDRNDDGGLSNQGLSEARADWVWAIGLTLAGLGMAAWSFRELGSPRRVLMAEDDGLFLAVGTSRRPEVFVPWQQVRSLRSTVVDDELGPSPVLELEMAERAWIPRQPVGARWAGRVLQVDAAGWKPPVHEVAGALHTMLERSRLRGEKVDLADGEPLVPPAEER